MVERTAKQQKKYDSILKKNKTMYNDDDALAVTEFGFQKWLDAEPKADKHAVKIAEVLGALIDSDDLVIPAAGYVIKRRRGEMAAKLGSVAVTLGVVKPRATSKTGEADKTE